MIHVWEGGCWDADGGHGNTGVSHLVKGKLHSRQPWRVFAFLASGVGQGVNAGSTVNGGREEGSRGVGRMGRVNDTHCGLEPANAARDTAYFSKLFDFFYTK
jgi:hypothetical protein